MSNSRMSLRVLVAVLAIAAPLSVEHSLAGAENAPKIEVTVVPPPGGGPDRMERISGRVTNVDPRLFRLVIYSQTDRWYVQPFVAAPLTPIATDGTWSTRIHLGEEYAVLLVKSSFSPPATTFDLPKQGGDVVAIERIPARR